MKKNPKLMYRIYKEDVYVLDDEHQNLAGRDEHYSWRRDLPRSRNQEERPNSEDGVHITINSEARGPEYQPYYERSSHRPYAQNRPDGYIPINNESYEYHYVPQENYRPHQGYHADPYRPQEYYRNPQTYNDNNYRPQENYRLQEGSNLERYRPQEYYRNQRTYHYDNYGPQENYRSQQEPNAERYRQHDSSRAQQESNLDSLHNESRPSFEMPRTRYIRDNRNPNPYFPTSIHYPEGQPRYVRTYNPSTELDNLFAPRYKR